MIIYFFIINVKLAHQQKINKLILILVLVFPFALLRLHAIPKGLQLTEFNQVFQDQQMC